MNNYRVFSASRDSWIGAHRDKLGLLPFGLLEPLVQGLTNQCQRWNEHQDAVRISTLSEPKGHERLACSAGHHSGDSVLLFETGENGFERFRLMGTRLLAFGCEDRA